MIKKVTETSKPKCFNKKNLKSVGMTLAKVKEQDGMTLAKVKTRPGLIEGFARALPKVLKVLKVSRALPKECCKASRFPTDAGARI